MPRKPTETGAARIKRQERIAAIIAMRLQGFSLQAIGQAQTPPVSMQRIHTIIFAELDRLVVEPTEKLRKLELMRLDELMTAYYERALGGDFAALDRVLAIQARRARLMGLDLGQSGSLRYRDGRIVEEDEVERVIHVEIVGDPELRRLQALVDQRSNGAEAVNDDDGPVTVN